MKPCVAVVATLLLVALVQAEPGDTKSEAPAETVPDPFKTIPDIPYADTDNPRQRLDIYLPQGPVSDKPLPVVVIAEIIGVPAGDRARLKEWSDALVANLRLALFGGPSEERLAQERRLIDEMRGYFVPLVADRRRMPREDLLSGLVAAELARRGQEARSIGHSRRESGLEAGRRWEPRFGSQPSPARPPPATDRLKLHRPCSVPCSPRAAASTRTGRTGAGSNNRNST